MYPKLGVTDHLGDLLAILRARDLARAPHVTNIAERYRYLTALGIEVDEALFERMCDLEVAEHGAPPPDRPPAGSETPSEQVTVYYVKVGRFIKIGQTQNWNARRNGYPPDARLLATERGKRNVLEWYRVLQFADDRAHGREWFHPSAALLQHIELLRTERLSPAELDFGD